MSTDTTQHNPNQSGEPLNPETYVKLRKLTTKDGEPIEDILHQALKQMGGLAEKATIQLRLIRVDEATSKCVHTIQLTPSGCFLQSEGFAKPTLTVITTAKTFRHMADGTYSPVQAYLDGKLHLQGDVGLGKKVILHLADSGTNVNVCPLLDAESWRPDGNGITGTLTFSGFNFTPSGLAVIHYDLGGASYPLTFIVADERGRFTVTATGMYCGDIPGKPGVGVIVSALDQASGQHLITGDQSYSTPC
jgi:hypothetical protein